MIVCFLVPELNSGYIDLWGQKYNNLVQKEKNDSTFVTDARPDFQHTK
tara:strand:+ start:500 stop:643 length:144 start_codon:yes stop_codon:yes gene_type:complete